MMGFAEELFLCRCLPRLKEPVRAFLRTGGARPARVGLAQRVACKLDLPLFPLELLAGQENVVMHYVEVQAENENEGQTMHQDQA